MAAAEVATVVKFFGETQGFWIQTGAFVLSALGAIAIIYNNSHQAKKRATVDLVLHNNTNEALNEARKEVAQYHAKNINFTQFACADLAKHPENENIMAIINNYEFIAIGIKEGAFDEEIYKRMMRSLLIRDWDGICAFVAELRRITHKDKLYVEFEWLAHRWKKSEIKPNVRWSRMLINWVGL